MGVCLLLWEHKRLVIASDFPESLQKYSLMSPYLNRKQDWNRVTRIGIQFSCALKFPW